MITTSIWHYLENQFDNATVSSRLRMNILIVDHAAKLGAKAGAHVTFQTLNTALIPVFSIWQLTYNDWRNKKAAYHSATLTLENLLAVLQISPPGAGRSRIDEWESSISGCFGTSDPYYKHFFPLGREPFTRSGRDNIIVEVGTLHTRLAEKLVPLQNEASAADAPVAALIAAGASVPAVLQDALDAANARTACVASLIPRVASFHAQLYAARTDQQGKEGLLDTASSAVELQRRRACRRLYSNLGRLMSHYTENPDAPEEEPQYAVTDFFDLDTLMRTGEEEEPDPAPPAPPP